MMAWVCLECGILNKNEDIDSALVLHIVEIPDHLALLDVTTLISEVNDFQHSFRKTTEILKIP